MFSTLFLFPPARFLSPVFIFHYSRGLGQEDIMTVVGFIDAALLLAVQAQTQSGPKLVDFKVNNLGRGKYGWQPPPVENLPGPRGVGGN